LGGGGGGVLARVLVDVLLCIIVSG